MVLLESCKGASDAQWERLIVRAVQTRWPDVKRVTRESELPTSLLGFTVGDHLLHSYINFTRTLPVFRDPRDHLHQLLTINVDVLERKYRLPADPCGSHMERRVNAGY
jgi:hypothetical protein